MNLLEIVPTLKTGGAEKFVVELCNELAQRKDINVQILQLGPITDADICAQSLTDKVSRISLNKKSGFTLKAMLGVFRYIRKNQITHVHAHTSAISYILLPALFCRKVKFYATIHNDAKVDAIGSFIIPLIRKILFKMRLCMPVTISDESNKSFMEFYGMNAPLIYNGIGIKHSKGEESPFVEKGLHFVHVARVSPQKNQVTLYQAFNKLVAEGTPAYLYHYGRFDDSDISNELRSLCNEHIKIMGETSNVPNILHFADALCLSSNIEGMPMTIIEALSSECPVICTPVGGCINMITDGENGILSKDTTVDEYYLALKRFVDLSSEKINEMKKRAKESFSLYDIRNTANKYLELFEMTPKR